MICRNCGEKINNVLIRKFNREGNDYVVKAKICEEINDCDNDCNAITFLTDADWCGYGLDSEDNIDDVRCPICSKPLFYEVQQYEQILVVGFCEKRKESKNE